MICKTGWKMQMIKKGLRRRKGGKKVPEVPCYTEARVSLKLWAFFFSERLNLSERRGRFLSSDVTVSRTTWFYTLLFFVQEKLSWKQVITIFSSSFVIACRGGYFPVSLLLWAWVSAKGLFVQRPHVGSKCEIHSIPPS